MHLDLLESNIDTSIISNIMLQAFYHYNSWKILLSFHIAGVIQLNPKPHRNYPYNNNFIIIFVINIPCIFTCPLSTLSAFLHIYHKCSGRLLGISFSCFLAAKCNTFLYIERKKNCLKDLFVCIQSGLLLFSFSI